MLKFRFGLLVIATLILLVPTGCKDDSSDPVLVPEKITSPVQLTEWLEQLSALIRATDKSGAETSRILAYSSIAYYEGYSLNSEEMRSLVGQVQGLEALPQPDPSLSYNFGITAEAAMYTVLNEMFADEPSNIQLIISSTYTDHERDYITLGITESIVNRSREFGILLGEAILDWAAEDGFSDLASCSTTVPTGFGNWQPTPPSFTAAQNACWGDLRPFTYGSNELVALCNPGIPEAVDTASSSFYFSDVTEVFEIGNNENPGEVEIARFWDDGSGTFTVPGHYISILKQLVAQNLLNGEESVSAFAQLSIAMADTYISTYKLKYTYFRPRPLTTIQATLDMNWNSEMDNPSTPEYPSLRSTMAYAATQVFINLYGDIEIKDNSYTSILGIDERIYSSFTEMGQEAAYSRIYAGTNLRTTIENSEYHGRCIAQRTNELFFGQ